MSDTIMKGVIFLAFLWVLMKVFSVIPGLLIAGGLAGFAWYKLRK